jgi:acyl-coenzyme A synthetase/AMP-(fatty) acid ligase
MNNYSNDIALKEPACASIVKQYNISEQIGGNVFIAVSLADVDHTNWEDELCRITVENKTYTLNRETCNLLKQFDGRRPLSEIITMFIEKENIEFILQNNNQDFKGHFSETGTKLHTVITKMIKYKFIIYLHNSFNAAGITSYHAQFRLSDWEDNILEELISHTLSGSFYTHLSYCDVNNNVRQIANKIAQFGLDSNSVIAISVKSRLCLTIAALAAIYSGYTFTCIYPEFSNGHKTNILKSTRASLIISDYDHELDSVPNINIILSTEHSGDERAIIYNSNNETLYICSTSGTTGNPKNIRITKRGLHNYISYRQKHYATNKNDNTLQLLTENSDVFWGSLFPGLISGGSVLFCEYSNIKNYEQISKIIEDCKISNFSATPRMFEAILEISEPNQLDSLKSVIIGGEPASNYLFEIISQRQLFVRLLNEYGTTETTITCCVDLDFSSKSIDRIGQPISHTKILIVDEAMQCVPALIHGEILVSGIPLAEDLDDADLREIDGNIYYCTGDIGYYDHDGHYHYVKRKNSIIKINGVRLDINQLEAIVCLINGVKSVKALVIEAQRSQKMAIFIISDRQINEATILEHIQENIYLYAIPIQIVFIEKMPVNTNGKIDTHKLRDLLNQSSEMKTTTNKDLEHIVHGYWCKYIEVNEIDNNIMFFEAGGNSILLTKMFKDMKDNLFGRLKLTDYFTYPTIEKFAEYLSTQNIIVKE